MKTKNILVAALFLAFSAGAANAANVMTETRITPKPVAGPDIVDYRSFDTNHDGTLTMIEVGERLFYTFDKDGNQLIDNIEFTRPMVLTFAPMEKQTVQFVDYNGDGLADQKTVSQQMFLQSTGLSQFDNGGNGLSASEFIKKPIKKVDRDLSGQIDIKEWKETYFAVMRPMPQNDTFRYNE